LLILNFYCTNIVYLLLNRSYIFHFDSKPGRFEFRAKKRSALLEAPFADLWPGNVHEIMSLSC